MTESEEILKKWGPHFNRPFEDTYDYWNQRHCWLTTTRSLKDYDTTLEICKLGMERCKSRDGIK